MNFAKFHDKNYKYLLLIPTLLLVASMIYLGIFYAQNNDFIYKDISLSGGTSATLTGEFNEADIINNLSSKMEDLRVRSIYDMVSQKQKAIIIETKLDSQETKDALEEYLGYELTDKNSSFEFTGSSLSESFYSQLIIAILVAFLFMAIVVFILFRSMVPSSAVIISAFADIVMTLAFVDLIGMRLSTAGIVAFLMLIGYSVDTDILLTTRILKRNEGNLNERAYGAFKTGMTMTLTSILAVSFALVFVYSFSVVLSQIFTILIIGLVFDMVNTWITNASILKWYMEAKKWN